MPDASTRMSMPPNRLTAASTILSQFAAEFGRRFTASVLAPSPSHSAATFFSTSAPPAASTRLQPAPASTLAASAPNAPEAPVTIAVLPRTSNSDSGFFRKSSDMTDSQTGMNLSAVMAGHSASKTRVNALMPGHPRLSYLKNQARHGCPAQGRACRNTLQDLHTHFA